MGPRIAVTLCGHATRRCETARGQYLDAIRRAGAEPIAIDPADAIPAEFDGLLLTGGGDVDPSRYGADNVASTEVDEQRDALEFALLERALARDLPVLGVCRGFQIINVRFGGSLEQHHPGHSPKYPPAGATVVDDPAGADAVRHVTQAEAGSKLAAACGDDPLVVNSSHHQVVTADRLAADLRATARVDELVEALESSTHRWVVAVQWHPERTAQVSAGAARIFDAFVAAVKRTPVTAA
ncbi:MAG TPA: gamma-glutamyl-gamma-aminobutyrate hydrolase family protein [Candidatus Limnocylindria bacterium]|nr:gamma-glutamyl-gamma-aminobutyrate hydrolase family protein [Candidatus Limnocylindria bacterium]